MNLTAKHQQGMGSYLKDFFAEEKLGISLSPLTKSPCEMAVCSFFFLCVFTQSAQFHGGDYHCDIASHWTVAGTFEATLIKGCQASGR